MLKVLFIVLVVCSIALLLYLFYLSQKLLRQTQKQAAKEQRELQGNYQVHPQLDKELEKLAQLKKDIAKKKK